MPSWNWRRVPEQDPVDVEQALQASRDLAQERSRLNSLKRSIKENQYNELVRQPALLIKRRNEGLPDPLISSAQALEIAKAYMLEAFGEYAEDYLDSLIVKSHLRHYEVRH